ncbi:nuclear transport factor 2 family protein [Paenibacillus sp. BJ-4]|uniref:nuclear transport factor 2 family protein n=1 Tax=Paenibacillus sp. BJ-4 TaxID=2878097 RepID=UPI001CF03985|nr:nuclear transport factor 2 family protein [Paenibacillus sp. BJ-4]
MSRTTLEDYEEIVNVLNGYIEGNISGKSELMKSSFHKDAIMYGYTKDGNLSEGSIQNLYEVVDQSGPAQNLQFRIDILDVADTIAMARVILENAHGATYTDYHQLLKVDGEWKVIAKLFHQH